MKVSAIVLAAGLGSRMSGKTKKQFLRIGGKPILFYSLKTFELCRAVDEIILVVKEEDLAFAAQDIVDQYGISKVNKIIPGGAERQDSVLCGLTAVGKNPDIVVIHDGVRPFVTKQQIENGIQNCTKYDAVVCAVPVSSTIKQVKNGVVLKTINRKGLWEIQTPQIFNYKLILSAYQDASSNAFTATDDAMILERLGKKVHILPSDRKNIKITTCDDLDFAGYMIKKGIWCE